MIEAGAHNAKIGKITAAVNGIITGRIGAPERSSYRPMLEEIVARIEQRLIAIGLTASAASKEAGLSSDAIRNLKRAVHTPAGRQGASTHTLTALAPVLQTTASWLLTGEGEEAPDRYVPIVGYVGAGSQAVLFSEGQGPFGEVRAPDNATDKTVAVEIRGESLGSFFNEWLVFYDDVRSPVTPDLIGKLCVVGLPDGRILVKKIQRSKSEGTFHLLSQTEDPLLDVPIEWAARVKTMMPR